MANSQKNMASKSMQSEGYSNALSINLAIFGGGFLNDCM